jgi:hypothetical protein
MKPVPPHLQDHGGAEMRTEKTVMIIVNAFIIPHELNLVAIN